LVYFTKKEAARDCFKGEINPQARSNALDQARVRFGAIVSMIPTFAQFCDEQFAKGLVFLL
jgi:hypothetical protein